MRLMGVMGLTAWALMASPAAAQDMSQFNTGPVIADFGPHANVPEVPALPADTQFAIAFNASAPAGENGSNRSFESVARFLNMTAAAGVPKENVKLALVVYGPAGLELLQDAAYAAHPAAKGEVNPSGKLVEALLAAGVRVILCGQTVPAFRLPVEGLIDGVELSLSSIAAHALLQQEGYTVNPS
ncbi:MAG: DsrE family protein [Erythrobacter sp.]